MSRGLHFDTDEVDFAAPVTPDTEFTVLHTLTVDGKPIIPHGWGILSQSAAGSLYPGPTTWTTSAVYLKSSVASLSGTLLLF